jgi:endonuclease/exonuclease/phosphatase family metal-dependent hydrolase
MKRLSWFNKVMYFFNVVLALLTIVAYILPFLTPRMFPFLSVLTLVLPAMLIFNFLFFLYWLLQTKRQLLLSLIILLAGITFINKLYKFSATNLPQEPGDITFMTYNVRLFNLYDWMPDRDVAEKISGFVKQQAPDIVCLQEYSQKGDGRFVQYRHRFVFKAEKQTSQAIFSKYPIIDSGNIKFPDSGNNVIYADIVKGKDTIRIYSMHMQSIKISPDIHEEMDEERSKMIFRRLSGAFKQQQMQAELLQKHKNDCRYPTIICGDLNNSAFSYVYRNIKGNMHDAFVEAGNGFGKSYNYKYYPARIDYVFADEVFRVKQYRTFNNFVYSDHFPIITRLSLNNASEEEK